MTSLATPPVALWRDDLELRSLSAGGHLLLDGRRTREDLEEYRGRAGDLADGLRGADLVDAVEASGLVGHGGAAFPTGTKLRSVADRPGPRFVVANGDEGEPLSVKDRWLMRVRPHLVLDGLLRVAEAVGADLAYVYVTDPVSADSVRDALVEWGTVPVPVEVFTLEASYVGGEESSVVRALNGGPALPTDKPPRPFEEGVDGRPTLVLNIETLANVPRIAHEGASSLREVEVGRRGPGTFLMTLSGAVEHPGLYEVALGEPLAATIDRAGGTVGDPAGYLMGGYFAGFLGPRARAVPLDYGDLRDEGSGLGCGAVVVLGPDDCPVAVAAEVMRYFDAENAHQCGPCFRGTASMATALGRLSTGEAQAEEIERLQTWSHSLRGRGACATLDGAANIAGTVMREFPAEIEAHQAGPCPRCASPGPILRRGLFVPIDDEKEQ